MLESIKKGGFYVVNSKGNKRKNRLPETKWSLYNRCRTGDWIGCSDTDRTGNSFDWSVSMAGICSCMYLGIYDDCTNSMDHIYTETWRRILFSGRRYGRQTSCRYVCSRIIATDDHSGDLWCGNWYVCKFPVAADQCEMVWNCSPECVLCHQSVWCGCNGEGTENSGYPAVCCTWSVYCSGMPPAEKSGVWVYSTRLFLQWSIRILFRNHAVCIFNKRIFLHYELW